MTSMWRWKQENEEHCCTEPDKNAQMVWGKRSIDLRLFLSCQQKKHAILFACFVSGYVIFKSP